MIPVSKAITTYAITRSLFEMFFSALRFKSSSINREVRTALRVGSRNELNSRAPLRAVPYIGGKSVVKFGLMADHQDASFIIRQGTL